ncbi:synaptotagmin-like protein 2 isoform X1 [Siphateles boraxobius]|uniref:synaptotagmin-like protein 2 isoform X1 n=1 Tax=Siphateles boraxobius TaxID=180520 RepID=UPI004062AFB2
MKLSKSASELIDLSFLSAEEEAAIRQVLLRDEDLKRLESGRVRTLRQSVPDLQKLKTLTGEWFEELREKRYGLQTDATAVVRTSMRWKKTAAHKTNPFLNDIVESIEQEKEEHSTPPNPFADPRLIHPALSKETYHQYTDDDFTDDEASSAPRVSGRKKKLQAEIDGNHVLIGNDPKCNPTEAQPKQLSDDRITTVFPFSRAVQDTKPERGPAKHATNQEPRRKVSLPPALQKDQSFEENWVKISLEPNAVKPVHDESNSVGPELKEVKSHVEITETQEKQDTSSPSLNFMDQTSFQIESDSDFSQDVFLERCSSTKFQNQPQTSLVFTSDEPEFTRHSDHEGSEKANESSNVFQDNKGRDQQCSAEVIFRASESPSDSTNEHDKRSMVSSDFLNDEASSDRKGGGGKNVSPGLRAETDADQILESVAGKEQINKHSSAEEASQSQSLKWEIEMSSHEFPSNTLQGKDASTDSGDDGPVEMGKKKMSNKKEALLLNKTADASVNKDFEAKRSVSDKTVQRLIDAHEDKEKIKLSNDQNLPKDIIRKLSQEYLSMTDDGKLVHIKDAGLHVDSEHIDKSSVEPIQPAKPTSEDDAGLGQGSSELKDEEDSADILLSVLARAQRARPPVLQKITALEPNQEIGDDTVPTIVIIPSESPDPTELKGNKHGVSVLEALFEGSTCKTPSYTADAWKDEGVDSDDDDDDDTSLSSYGSDLSSRKGYSASALTLTDRTGSLLSVYSDAGDFGNVAVQGSVEFAVMYSPVGELIIMIEQCQDLAVANPRKQRTDPYVKTYLYPDKSRRSKRKTSIKKRTVNPVYVESLRYKVKREELPEKTLNLSVWHNDSRGRNVFLGQVEISLKTWDWGHEALTWYNLQSTTAENQESQESNGFLSVSLKYVPQESTGGSKNSTGEIHVWLREAKELRGLKPQGVDSFVKCYILPDTRKKSRQKTRVVKKSQDPVYNHAMVYDGFKAGEVSEACCELTVWDHNKLSNQFLGGLRLSLGTGKSYGKKVDWMDSLNEEVQIWKRMLANPNCWVEGELPLRSSMTPRK